MPRTYKREPGSRRYADFTSENLENALKAMRAGMGLRKASRDFKVPKGTLANRYKGLHSKPFGGQVVFNNDEENAFVEHMRVVAEWGFPFDTFDLRVLAKTYLDKVGRVVSKFKNNYPSRDWANNFLARHKDKITLRTCQNIKTARAKVSSALVNEYFDNLTATLSDIPHDRIFNYDETNLSDNPGLKKCIFKRGTKYPERIRDSSKAAICISIADLPPVKCCHPMSFTKVNICGPHGPRMDPKIQGTIGPRVDGLMPQHSPIGFRLYLFRT